MGIRAGKLSSLILIIPVSKQLQTDNIYESYKYDGEDACTYKHFT